jgi:hypothetical protein
LPVEKGFVMARERRWLLFAAQALGFFIGGFAGLISDLPVVIPVFLFIAGGLAALAAAFSHREIRRSRG